MKRMMMIVIGGAILIALIAIDMTSAQQAEQNGSIQLKGKDEPGFAGMT